MATATSEKYHIFRVLDLLKRRECICCIARMRDQHGGPHRETVNSRETKYFGGDKRLLGRPLGGVPDLWKYSMAYCGSSRNYNNVGRRISARRTRLPTCNVDFSLWLYEALQRYHAWCSSERKTTRKGNPACRGGKAIEPCQRRKGTFSRAERCLVGDTSWRNRGIHDACRNVKIYPIAEHELDALTTMNTLNCAADRWRWTRSPRRRDLDNRPFHGR